MKTVVVHHQPKMVIVVNIQLFVSRVACSAFNTIQIVL